MSKNANIVNYRHWAEGVTGTQSCENFNALNMHEAKELTVMQSCENVNTVTCRHETRAVRMNNT